MTHLCVDVEVAKGRRRGSKGIVHMGLHYGAGQVGKGEEEDVLQLQLGITSI